MVSLGLFRTLLLIPLTIDLYFKIHKTVAQASYQNTASVQRRFIYVTVRKGCGATNVIIAGSIGANANTAVRKCLNNGG